MRGTPSKANPNPTVTWVVEATNTDKMSAADSATVTEDLADRPWREDKGVGNVPSGFDKM